MAGGHTLSPSGHTCRLTGRSFQFGKHRSLHFGTEAAALEQNSIISIFLFFFLLVHLNVYLELHFVNNLPFLFPSELRFLPIYRAVKS